MFVWVYELSSCVERSVSDQHLEEGYADSTAVVCVICTGCSTFHEHMPAVVVA